MIGIQYFNFKFYAVFFRFWEFLSGSISYFLFISIKNKKFKFQKIISALGIVCLISLFFLNLDLENHPGTSTLSTVFLTSLTILFINRNIIVSKILNSKIFQFLGLISYSFYLWHDPVIKILDRYNQNNQLFEIYTGYIYKFLVTLIISHFSYYYIEEQLRRTRNIKLFYLLITSILILLLSTFFLLSNEKSLEAESVNYDEDLISKEVVTNTTVLNYDDKNLIFDTSNKSPQQEMFDLNSNKLFLEGIKKIRVTPAFSGNKLEGTCFITGFNKLDVNSCTEKIDERSDNILFLGDSTAHNYFFPFKKVLNNIKPDQNVYLLSVTGCIPLIDSYSKLYDFVGKDVKCEDNYRLIKSVIRENRFEAIYVSYRYTYFSEISQNDFIESSSFYDFLKELNELAIDNNVIVIGQSIEWTEKAANLNREDIKNKSVQVFSDKKLYKKIFKIDNILKKNLENSKIKYFSLIENYCFDDMCQRYIMFGEDLYAVTIDYIHVSSRFGQIVTKNFLLNYLEN